MSMRSLPLVFINLGGEMLYILDQRLQAHNTSEDNSEKVINDIVGTLFSKAFMDELLKPQQLYSHRTMKTVLNRLAHASIMRLNPASMDRLYELMLMTFKHQVFLCPRPKDLLLISYNHIDTIRQFVKDTPVVMNQVDEAHRKIIEIYSSLSEGEFQLLRQTLLIFVQDMHVRVSLFLKSQIQNPNGGFTLSTSGPLPHGIDVPGLIRMFDSKGREVRRSKFPTGGSYSSSIREGSFELHGDRVITLGTNVYANTTNLLAKEELNLLARLMGSMKAENMPRAETGFRINMFTTDQMEEEAGTLDEAEEPVFGVINIQAMQDEQAATELAHIAGQFTEQEEQPDKPCGNNRDELLAMMDDL
ncbi:Protein OSCP1 [Channa argus]|uniref:Protein OSCP1 n=1 Tax=Channa argus TaxID=215402 RepID=A0A6G1QXJ5_CHAAH|nr:Protein OSCP1 [Channa argus]